MKIITVAWIDGECVGEATAEQLEQHRLGTLPDNVELEQEGRFDAADGSVPDCDVRLSWVARNGRESFVADGDEWTDRAEKSRPDSWNDIDDCDELDNYWDRCLRILGEGKRDFKVEILIPYDADDDDLSLHIKKNERAINWAYDIIADVRIDTGFNDDAELWNHIEENWHSEEWQRQHNLDDGPADLPPHQYADFFAHVLNEIEYALGQTTMQKSDAWHRQQAEERMFRR